MSDGNFNRSLLPHGGYQSGVRAGRAAERTRAVEVLGTLLAEEMPHLAEDDRVELVRKFKERLSNT